ncbi:MAG: C40 family peptidase [Alphaproteobacteria bacterium]|nr:C40 family peptidase [Alphaproteobacteria bacterium]
MAERRAQVQTSSAFMRLEPDARAEGSNELLFGEQVDILEAPPENADGVGWVKARSLTDGYEGYIRADSLSDRVTEATHRLKMLRSHIYPAPDFKAPPLMALSFLSPVTLSKEHENGFTLTEHGGWVFAAHFADAAERAPAPDPAETALRFEGVPYLWGGRTSAGLDCSALAQLCAMAAGHPCLRDSSQQQDTLGEDFRHATLQRGDFVFFKGHVGIMLDGERVINATARHMTTCIENCEDVAEAYGGIVAVRRLTPQA